MNWLKGRKRWQRVLLVVAVSMIFLGVLELVLPKGIMDKVGYTSGIILVTYLILEMASVMAKHVGVEDESK